MVDFKTARLNLYDPEETRFSIPQEMAPKQNTNKNMRLDMVGFQFEQDGTQPFSFSFRDVADPSNIYIDTKG